MPDLHKGVIKGMGEIRFDNNSFTANSKKHGGIISVAGLYMMFVCYRNPHQQFCLDQQDLESNAGLPVLVFDCHGEKGNQYW